MGLAALLRPLSITPAAQTSLVVLVAMVTVVFVMMRTGWRLRRAEGLFLVVANLVRWLFDMT